MSEAIAIIGGTGLSELEGLEIEARKVVPTPYGEPSAPILLGRMGGQEAVFLARHGSGHTIAPHRVNYRANIWALHRLGVKRVIAVNSVGGIADGLEARALVVPDQIVDYTWGRSQTFFEDPADPVVHVDFTEPYSLAARRSLLEAGRRAGLQPGDGGTYGATQGPRLESAAEIERMARDGCDMVGMTGMPEAALARELDLEYACLAVVINRAAGRGEGTIHGDIGSHLAAAMDRVRSLLAALLREEARP